MDAVEEIKSRLAIEDVIAEYVTLKRSGRNWKGLSPFNAEKTASFVVSPEKQIWHDFSSGKGGNVFSFVMDMEGIDFRAALELLARKSGVDLDQYNKGSHKSNTKKKERLYNAIELAAKFYQTQFSRNKEALSYILRERNFTKQTALKWQIGYSPNTGHALLDFLKSKSFTEIEMEQAGLISRRYNNLVDMFRGRIMIPLADSQGRIIGFTARALNEGPNAPKYINTPQTILYDKSRHIYGLHLAKTAIHRHKYAVLVEGNLDVIASNQVGVEQVVATAGTALTEYQLKALSRLTTDIRLCFDADSAGINATERAIPIASKVGVSLGIITIPTGKDPDELIAKSPEQWQVAIGKSQYALDWLINHYRKELDVTSAVGKRQFSDIIMTVVQRLADRVEQDHYIQEVANILGVTRDALASKLDDKNNIAKTTRRHVEMPIVDKTEESTKSQDHFLALMLMQPKLRDFSVPITEGMLLTLPAQQLLQFLHENPDFAGDTNNSLALESVSDYVKILSLQYEELYQDLDLLELRYEASRLQTYLIEQYVKTQKKQLSMQLKTAGIADTDVLLARAKQLDVLLKQVKES
jgi:DNA primase